MNRRERELHLENFFRYEYTGLYRYVLRLIHKHEDAMEIVQEAFLRFYRLDCAEEIHTNERALLFRLARNLSIDCRRRSITRESFQHCPADHNNVMPPLTKSPEDMLLERERERCFNNALSQLNEKEQEVLALRLAGLTHHEVAITLNINPGSISQTIARALQRFRKHYEKLLEKKGVVQETRSAR